MKRLLFAGILLLIASLHVFSEGAEQLDGKEFKENGKMDHKQHPSKNINSTKLKNATHHSNHHSKHHGKSNKAPDVNNEVLKKILETEEGIRKELQWQHQASELKELLDKDKEDFQKVISRKERATFEEGFNKISEGLSNAVDSIDQFGEDFSKKAENAWKNAQIEVYKTNSAPLIYGATLYSFMLWFAYYVALLQL